MPNSALMSKKSLSHRVAVIVECDGAVRHINVVSWMFSNRDDLLGVKARKWRPIEIHSGKDMTRAVAEKYSIRQCPAPLWIFLDA